MNGLHQDGSFTVDDVVLIEPMYYKNIINKTVVNVGNIWNQVTF